MKKFHIAVVEDDLAFASEMEEFLGAAGYTVSSYDSSQKFLAALRQSECDLLIVDWSIPDLSGIEVLEYIRKFHPDMPAIMLTARAENIDIVRGLEAGADDYVAKPVDPAVLAQRIKSLLRRSKGEVKNVSGNVILGRYLLRPSTSTIYLGDEEIVVPKREFDMAMLFFTNPNRRLSRQYLAATLWGKVFNYQSRTIDTVPPST